MIAVFLPALISEIFTAYFFIRISSLQLKTSIWECFDFLMWSFYFVMPTVVAIFISSKTVKISREIGSDIGKYSNSFKNDFEVQKVYNVMTFFKFVQFFNISANSVD